jgi:hypothetical protein
MNSVVRTRDRNVTGKDMDLTTKTHDKRGLTDEDIYMPSHFFGRKSINRVNSHQVETRKKKRTLSIVDKTGKPIKLRDTTLFTDVNAFPVSEYTATFGESGKPPRRGRIMSASSASTEVRNAHNSELMRKIIQCDYQAEHVEAQRENQRREFLQTRMTSGRPRVFRNFIDNNTNLLRRQLNRRKMDDYYRHAEKEAEYLTKPSTPNAEAGLNHKRAKSLIKPTKSIQRLFESTTLKGLSMSKIARQNPEFYAAAEEMLSKTLGKNTRPRTGVLSQRQKIGQSLGFEQLEKAFES